MELRLFSGDLEVQETPNLQHQRSTRWGSIPEYSAAMEFQAYVLLHSWVNARARRVGRTRRERDCDSTAGGGEH